MQILNDYMKSPGRWNGPDNTKNLREMKERYEAASAATPPIGPDPPDPLTAAQNEIARLQARVRELEQELLSSKSPHLRGREVRKA
jgi:hypothetical protein